MNQLLRFRSLSLLSLTAVTLLLGHFTAFAGDKTNTSLGLGALPGNTRGTLNTGLGFQALHVNTDGNGNTAVGSLALQSNTSGIGNTASGSKALPNNSTGIGNTADGDLALPHNITGNFNVGVGSGAGDFVFTADHVTCIGAGLAGADVSNTTWIANVYGRTTQGGLPVVVSSGGQLGTMASSVRFKKDIASMDKASETILSLRPITFHYKSDTQDTPQFGLIAEEVAKVNPALVVPDKEGKPYTVRYDAVNAMLLNEFLKEHRKVEQMQKQIDALTAGLQKVSAQLEVSRSVPQTALNN
jgi:Chaperone of endosialidase